MIKLISFFISASLIFACSSNNNNNSTITSSSNTTVPIIDFVYNNSFPHDTNSFIEGFLVNNGKLYESTGATHEFPQTRSLFGIVDLKTGKIDIKAEIDRVKYFGEGISILHGKIYQLTYKTKVGFIYDATTFKKIKEFTFPNEEGWGLTTNGTYLIMTDGTNRLTFLDPESLQIVKAVSVTENGVEKNYLNEPEYINGFIYANIYTTNTIVKIDPQSGKVVGILDLTSLADEAKGIYPGSLEMNGIAFDSITNKIFITGKFWPKIYEIKFKH